MQSRASRTENTLKALLFLPMSTILSHLAKSQADDKEDGKAEHKCRLPMAHYRYTMGKPTGMETCRSKLLVITGLHGSGFLFWVLRVLATSTHETKVFFIFLLILFIIYYITHFDVLLSVEHRIGAVSFLSFHKLC